MTDAPGKRCAAALAHCQAKTLLPQNKTSNTLLVATVSADNDINAFNRCEYNCYHDLRSAIPIREKRRRRVVIVSLSAPNSFSPLLVTDKDLRQLVIDEDVDPGFAAVVASFGKLPRASELGYSCMTTRTDEDGSYNLSYLLRFPEMDGKFWKIRQLGAYHRYCKEDDSHFWILVHAHPPSDDTLFKELKNKLATSDGCAPIKACPDLLHAFILDTYLPKWRWYLDHLGESYSDLSFEVGTVELGSGYECRATLASLQKCKRLLEKMATISAIMDALINITASMVGVQDQSTVRKLRMAISTHRQAAVDMRRSSDVLVRQTQGLVDLLGNTLNLKNQQDAAKVNSHLLKLSVRTAHDSIVIRVITLVTLFYLPATFVATLFGMDFFNFEDTSKTITFGHDIWIYFVVFIGLTGVTLLGWWIWTKLAARDESLRMAESNDEKV